VAETTEARPQIPAENSVWMTPDGRWVKVVGYGSNGGERIIICHDKHGGGLQIPLRRFPLDLKT
jgi:hypothetical protein